MHPCNEAGRGTASLMRSSVNHLLARMDSCSVNESGPCMDMFKYDCHDISVHHEANQGEKKNDFCLFLMEKACEEGVSHCLSCLIQVSVL